MSGDTWLKIDMFTTSEGIEPLYGMLLSMGIESAEIADEQDFESFLEKNTQYWDYVDEALRQEMHAPTRVTVYVRDDVNGRETLLLLRENVKRLKAENAAVGSLDIKIADVGEDDWFAEWKQYYKPFRVGDDITIVPAWEDFAGEGIVLRINPGMLFGTGSHNTTRLCIEILEKQIKPGCNVFDVGCGSGILSILSLLLGASSALAVDIDAAAPRIAHENAELNGIGKDVYTVLHKNILEEEVTDQRFDLVVANIVADVIIPLSAKVGKYIKEDGVFLCSGIIQDRLDDVLKALAQNGFRLLEKKQDGEWWAVLSGKE